MAKTKTKKQTKKQNNEPNKKKTVKFASDVQKYTKETYSQKFTSYNDIYGSEDIDYDLIDGLYHSTVLNKIMRKIASDAVPEMFKVQVVDFEGNRIEEIEQECFKYTAALKRKHVRDIFLTQMKYGTAFLYIGNKEEERITNPFLMHPKYITPQVKDGEIESWIYRETDEIEIPKEDLLCFPYDADIGEVFGYSFLGRLTQTLHLLLNTELNMAEIVDKFAIPIVQWMITQEEGEQLQDDELQAIVKSLQDQFEYSNDIVTTDRITTDIVGFNEKQYDMTKTLEALKESMGILSVAYPLLGGKADNLSAIKVQAQQYINDLRDLQMDLSDTLVEQLYEPFIQNTLNKVPGDDYANIYLVFPVLTTEANSDAAVWVFPALKHGLISRDEARAQFSFRGKAINTEDIEFIDPSYREYQDQISQNQGESNIDNAPSPSSPKKRDGTGDPDEKNNTNE